MHILENAPETFAANDFHSYGAVDFFVHAGLTRKKACNASTHNKLMSKSVDSSQHVIIAKETSSQTLILASIGHHRDGSYVYAP
eukprot:365142-Amorphochlora_amoeboformis.AAC.1